jgi:putative copper export protein/mono/diheme cytochrome c family protein/peroxiredoxin
MTGLTIASRVIHLGASLLLVGAFAFLLLVVRPACRKEKAENQTGFDRLDRGLLRVASWSLLALLLSSIGGLWVQLATATGHSPLQALTAANLWNILAHTQYGRVWAMRMALMALLGGFLWLRDLEGEAKDWWALRLEGAALAVGLLLAQAWMGHSATGEGLTLLYQTLADGLHLLAGGLWLGGLPLLLYLLSWALHSRDPHAEAVAAAATRRFSALALLCVGGLILTGLGNAWELVGTIPALVGTTYGRLLLLKLGLLLPLLALAALNLLRDKPRLAQALSHQESQEVRGSLRRLRRNVAGELIVAALILLIVGALGVLPPAYHDQPTWPFTFRLSWEATKDLPGVRTGVALGVELSMFGLFVAVLAAIIRLRYWLGIAAAGLLMVGAGFLVWLPKLAIDAYPLTYRRPTVPYNALSIDNGLRLYGEHCAVCHGVSGYGDGPAAPGMRPPPADLTAKHTADHTAGDIFWWLTHGKPGTAMPGFAAQLGEEDRWDLVNVVRALAAAERARALGPRVGANPWLVAPDFTYTSQLGEVRALKDHRGREQVLLVFYSLPYSRPRLAQLQRLYAEVRPLDVEVLAIPLRPDAALDDATAHRPLPFPHVRDGAAEAAVTYTLFGRSLTAQGSAPEPPTLSHLEFLIDRGGFLRGRWIPGEGVGWSNAKQLLAAIDVLRREKLEVPLPDLHVH